MVAKIAVITAIRPGNGSPVCAACSTSWSCGPWTWKPPSDMDISVVLGVRNSADACPTLVGDVGVFEICGGACGMSLPSGLAPFGVVEHWKRGVAFEVAIDLGQIELRGDGKRCPIELAS